MEASESKLHGDVQTGTEKASDLQEQLTKLQAELKTSQESRAKDQKKSAQALREAEATHKKAVDEFEAKLRAAEGDSAAELSKLRQ